MNALHEVMVERPPAPWPLTDVLPGKDHNLRRLHDGHRNEVMPNVVLATDVIATFLATLVVASGAHEMAGAATGRYILVAGILATSTFLLTLTGKSPFDAHRLYDPRRHARMVVWPLLSATISSLLAMWLLSSSISISLACSASWMVLGGILISVMHVLVWLVLQRPAVARRLTGRMAIIGTGEMARRVAQQFDSAAIDVIGFFDKTSIERADAGGLLDQADRYGPACGSIDELIAISRKDEIDGIIIALPPHREHEVGAICLHLRGVLADVFVTPNLLHGYDFAVPLAAIGPLALAVVQRRPLTQWQRLQKMIFDRLVGSILLFVVLPMLLTIAVLIKLDSPGPVFFRQPRLGFNNRPFTVLKFRSMHTNMTDLLADRQTSRNDPRVTRVGRWLRKLSLDELPQLLNVLWGEMSIVGPRPHAPNTRAGGKLLDDALAEYVIRHQVKPGITGWAQVSGARGELATLEQLRLRVSLDLEYMQRWSMMFDIKIMALTILREIFSRHAF